MSAGPLNLRAILRRTPEPVRWRWHRLRSQVRLLRDHGVRYWLRWELVRAMLTFRNAVGERRYVRLRPEEASAARRSETVFVFGSGYSLNDLSDAEWAHFAEHDVFGFSGFVYQTWVRVDFHLIRGWDEEAAGLWRWRRVAEAYAARLRANPRFRDAILVLQNDYGNRFANALVGCGLLPPGTRLCRYRTARCLDGRPSHRWRDGVTHGPSTLSDAVNVAYLLGWKRIVLVGVDMYDSRYFWGPPGDSVLGFDDRGEFGAVREATDRGIAWNGTHNTVRNGIIDHLGAWARQWEREDVVLSVYNPRSLLASVLPVYAAERVR